MTCDLDENCDEAHLVAQLSGSCYQCLLSQVVSGSLGPPPIEVCLTPAPPHPSQDESDGAWHPSQDESDGAWDSVKGALLDAWDVGLGALKQSQR